MFRFSINKWFWILPIFAAAVLITAGLNFPRRILYPSTGKFDFVSMTDAELGGDSRVVNFKKSETGLRLEYLLSDGFLIPFSGIIGWKQNQKELDISLFDTVMLKVKSTSPGLNLFMYYTINGYTRRETSLSYLLKEVTLPVSPHLTEYRKKLEDFSVPVWWYFYNREITEAPPEHDESRMAFFAVTSGDNYATGASQEIVLEELILYRDPAPLFLGAGVFFFLYYVVLFYINSKLKRKESPNFDQLTAGYKKIHPSVEMSNSEEGHWDRLISYIHNNYTDPSFSQTSITEALGFSVKKTAKLFKDYQQMTFKQYLNGLRIEEAKKLLISTDRKITEIAFVLGYNNQSHFNRIFKELTGLSPGEYRKREQR